MTCWIRGFALAVAALLMVMGGALGWLVMTTPEARDREGWILGPSLPLPFGELTTVVVPNDEIGERLVVLSGIAGLGRVVDDVYMFDSRIRTWERGPNLPAPRHHAAAAVLDGAVVISGGAETLDSRPWQGLYSKSLFA